MHRLGQHGFWRCLAPTASRQPEKVFRRASSDREERHLVISLVVTNVRLGTSFVPRLSAPARLSARLPTLSVRSPLAAFNSINIPPSPSTKTPTSAGLLNVGDVRDEGWHRSTLPCFAKPLRNFLVGDNAQNVPFGQFALPPVRPALWLSSGSDAVKHL